MSLTHYLVKRLNTNVQDGECRSELIASSYIEQHKVQDVDVIIRAVNLELVLLVTVC